jgi:hypothetical protein
MRVTQEHGIIMATACDVNGDRMSQFNMSLELYRTLADQDHGRFAPEWTNSVVNANASKLQSVRQNDRAMSDAKKRFWRLNARFKLLWRYANASNKIIKKQVLDEDDCEIIRRFGEPTVRRRYNHPLSNADKRKQLTRERLERERAKRAAIRSASKGEASSNVNSEVTGVDIRPAESGQDNLCEPIPGSVVLCDGTGPELRDSTRTDNG